MSDSIFVKTKSGALTSGAFAAFISENRIGGFYVCGAAANACVKSACFNMTKAGYSVHVISDCVTSREPAKAEEMLRYCESKGCEVSPPEAYMERSFSA